ncbi:NAD(P)H-quinone oxidoreductase [Consotaella aegiceratis]|uniref:NAD(P)H-quinone oxidoreductase n=1 Tax=Consotaella aegiceratis TaxID=3097961 RepID=UPI002F42D336
MAPTSTMTVIAITEPGGPEVLAEATRPIPTPGPRDLLIEVHAAGVNRPDALQRLGAYPPPPGAPDWPGLEVAGIVTACGAETSRFTPGDRVMALLPGGGYGEACVVAEGNALPIPQGLSMVEAAAVPETFFTVWHNVFERGRLERGETFLVHGGASGIGTTAIQLGRVFGATVLATVGSEEKCEAVRALGATTAINYRDSDFVEAALAATKGRGVDLILDMVGGDYLNRNLQVAAEDGRIVQIAFLKGAHCEIDASLLMRKRLTLTGSTLRNRPVEVKAALARGLETNVWPFLASGAARPVIEAVYPLAQAAEAHRHLDRDHVGKIVLTMPCAE